MILESNSESDLQIGNIKNNLTPSPRTPRRPTQWTFDMYQNNVIYGAHASLMNDIDHDMKIS